MFTSSSSSSCICHPVSRKIIIAAELHDMCYPLPPSEMLSMVKAAEAINDVAFIDIVARHYGEYLNMIPSEEFIAEINHFNDFLAVDYFHDYNAEVHNFRIINYFACEDPEVLANKMAGIYSSDDQVYNLHEILYYMLDQIQRIRWVNRFWLNINPYNCRPCEGIIEDARNISELVHGVLMPMISISGTPM